jgi:phage gp36-like protein
MFLTKEELQTVADYEIIDIITNDDDTIVEQIIIESIEKMKSYIGKYYDAESVFSKEGNERNMFILKMLKDIVIYEIYERRTRQTNEVAARRYAEAMNWLTSINTGEISADNILPTVPPDTDGEGTDGTSGDVRFGGSTKYQSIY